MIELQTEEPQKNKTHTWRLYWFHETDPDASYPANAETLAKVGFVPQQQLGLFWRNQAEQREGWLKERESQLTAANVLASEQRSEIETLSRCVSDLNDGCVDLEKQIAAERAKRENLEQRILWLCDMYRDTKPENDRTRTLGEAAAAFRHMVIAPDQSTPAAPAPAEGVRKPYVYPDHAVTGAIAFLRENWRNNDGAEGESVKLVCDELERMRKAEGAKAAEGEDVRGLLLGARDLIARHLQQSAAWDAECHGLRRKLATLEAERAALVELLDLADELSRWVIADEVKPGPGLEKSTWEAALRMQTELKALRAQPSPPSEGKDSHLSTVAAVADSLPTDAEDESIVDALMAKRAAQPSPPSAPRDSNEKEAPKEADSKAHCAVATARGPRRDGMGGGESSPVPAAGQKVARLDGETGTKCTRNCEGGKSRDPRDHAVNCPHSEPAPAAEVEQAAGEAKGFVHGQRVVVSKAANSRWAGCTGRVAQLHQLRVVVQLTDNIRDSFGYDELAAWVEPSPPSPLPGGYGPTEALRAEIVAALRRIADLQVGPVREVISNVKALRVVADELAKGGK